MGRPSLIGLALLAACLACGCASRAAPDHPRGTPVIDGRPAAGSARAHPWDGHRAATYARSLLGRPYCWGGSGPACFDCSGLTYRSWQWAGIAVPRTSSAQHRRLSRVRMDMLAPGDILWRPGHVGMYVGDGWAIHAPGRGKPVQYQPANRFRSAHRP